MELTYEMYRQMASKMYGLIIIDTDYNLVFLEKTYAKLLGVDSENIKGRSIFDVFPETRLHKVIETGQEMLGEIYHYNGLTFTCNRYPLLKDGKVIGAFAHWANTTDQLIDLIARLKNQIKLYSEDSIKHTTSHYTITDIIGGSTPVDVLRSIIIAAALSNSTILIQGETGTGKELVAHSIHHSSSRAARPFIKLNCAAIPSDLIESELFGYKEGAFTGARKGGYKGKFEQANGGTIFLDEISQLSLPAQAKLLRVLQEKEIVPLGGDITIFVDVRIIACTNDDLKEKVRLGEFREDLFYRLNVIPIKVPSLRERLYDIPSLVNFFLNKHINISGKSHLKLDNKVYDYLKSYTWPGNIRELEHAIERVVSLCYSDTITIEDFSWLTTSTYDPKKTAKTLTDKIEMIERDLILEALQSCQGNKKKTAEILGIARPLLYQKMKRLNIVEY